MASSDRPQCFAKNFPQTPLFSMMRNTFAFRKVAHAQEEKESDIVVPKRKINWYMMSPLMWAPIFPTVRIMTRENRELQRKSMIGLIILANLHAVGIFFGNYGSFGYN